MKGFVLLLCILSVSGYPNYQLRIPNGSNVTHPCPGKGLWEAVGHMKTTHTVIKNVFGQAFKQGGKKWSRALCMQDSDGDGLTNGEELGDPLCKWVSGRAPAQVRGHPGFCEPDRPSCKSGSMLLECKNPNVPKDLPSKKKRIRLPPGANDHPQTLKLKEIMRMNNRNSQGMQRGGVRGRPGFTGMPSTRQRWRHPQQAMLSNDITRATRRPRVQVRNRWAQSATPAVGQSVFGQNYPPSRNTGGSFTNNRERHGGQPLTLTRDFGMNINNNVDSTRSRNSFDNRINRFANIGRQDASQFSSNSRGTSSGMRTWSPSQVQNTGSQNMDTGRSGSFQRQPSRWDTFSDGSSFRRDTMSQSDTRFMPRSSADRTSFDGMRRTDVRSGMDTMQDRSRGRVNTNIQSNNMLQDVQRGVSNSLTGSSGDQTMTGSGMNWAASPGMPGLQGQGMPDVPLPGGGMRFPPF